MSFLYLLVILISIWSFGNSARILGVVPTPSYSHQVVFRPLWRELSRKGHDLVVITTDPENDPRLNIREIDISFAHDLWVKKHNFIKQVEQLWDKPFETIRNALNVVRDIHVQELLHPEVQAILKNETEHFDLIIVEHMHVLMVGFAGRFKSPYIEMSSRELFSLSHSTIGNPVHPILHPDPLLPFEGKLNFWQRLMSTLTLLAMYVLGIALRIDSSVDQQLMEEYFGKDLPPIDVIRKNVSMIFINVDPSTYLRPLGPATIAIGGGTHLTSFKALPKDLQEYLDGAENGAIYFSLGTNVRSEIVPPEMRKVFLETFRELPYRVLWKFDVTDIPDVPENVKIVKWLPQQDVLRHTNIKVFITQGGLQSMEEAIFSNVPVVGIPFISDQTGNVKRMVRKGFGVYLDKHKLTKESLKKAILEVINNSKYKERTIEVAKLSKDQPMTGLEKAVWWTEYVIRHRGTPHFRNPIMDLPFYQYYLLDVIGFISTILAILTYITFKIIVFIKNLILRKSNSSKKIKKQ